jgi:hypothetical protein
LHSDAPGPLSELRESGLELATPVNTLAVLSRADEVGGGRPDAMDSAQRIAARYLADPKLRALASTTLAVAGLLAETGATLEETEFSALRLLTARPQSLDRLLLSVERFRDPERNPLASALRERLLERFGLFGLRFATTALIEGRAASAQELSGLLLERSGLRTLLDLIQQRFTAHARVLIARSVMSEVYTLTASLRLSNVAAAERLDSALEEIMASSHELAELQLLHDLAVGALTLTDAEAAEVHRLLEASALPSRLGLKPEVTRDRLRIEVRQSIARWRGRGASSLTDRPTAVACETIVRTYEGLFASLS